MRHRPNTLINPSQKTYETRFFVCGSFSSTLSHTSDTPMRECARIAMNRPFLKMCNHAILLVDALTANLCPGYVDQYNGVTHEGIEPRQAVVELPAPRERVQRPAGGIHRRDHRKVQSLLPDVSSRDAQAAETGHGGRDFRALGE